MKKIILTLTASAILTQIIFAQKNNTSPNISKKKYAISCGASSNFPFNYLGGNFKIDYLLNHKLGVGLKTVAIPCKFYNYTAHLNYYTATYTSGLMT